MNKSLILSSNNPIVMLPGILSSTWNLIKSSLCSPEGARVGWSGASELRHTSSSASQWETERSQRSRVGTSDNGTLWIFLHSFFREGNKCLVLFHHYFIYNNQKRLPTIFFFLNRASLPITLVSCAKLLTPHGVSGDDRVRHLDNSLPTRLAAPFIDPQSSITPLICQYLPGRQFGLAQPFPIPPQPPFETVRGIIQTSPSHDPNCCLVTAFASLCVPQEPKNRKAPDAPLHFMIFFITRKTSILRKLETQTLLSNFSRFKSHLSSRPITPTQSCAIGTAHCL